MGQQETTMAVATEEKGGGALLRRIVLVLLVAALMAAMMAASAMPAMAKNSGPQRPGPPTTSGKGPNQLTEVVHCQAFPGGQGVVVDNKNGTRVNGNC